MTIEAKLDQTNELLARLITLAEAQVSGGTRPAKEKPAKPATEKPKDATPAPVEAKQVAQTTAAAPNFLDDDEPAATPAKLEKADIRAALVAHQKKVDPTGKATMDLLGKYEAKSISTLKEDKYAGLYAEVRTVLGSDADKMLADAKAASAK
jgi:hypothetical protein